MLETKIKVVPLQNIEEEFKLSVDLHKIRKTEILDQCLIPRFTRKKF